MVRVPLGLLTGFGNMAGQVPHPQFTPKGGVPHPSRSVIAGRVDKPEPYPSAIVENWIATDVELPSHSSRTHRYLEVGLLEALFVLAAMLESRHAVRYPACDLWHSSFFHGWPTINR